MKKIGFLSFGHFQPRSGSQTRTAADALLQTIELAEAAARRTSPSARAPVGIE